MRLVFLHDATEKYALAAALLRRQEEAEAMLQERPAEELQFFVVRDTLAESYLIHCLEDFTDCRRVIFMDTPVTTAMGELLLNHGIDHGKWDSVLLDIDKKSVQDIKVLIRRIADRLKNSRLGIYKGVIETLGRKCERFRQYSKYEEIQNAASSVYTEMGDATLFYHLITGLSDETEWNNLQETAKKYLTFEAHLNIYADNVINEASRHLDIEDEKKRKDTAEEILRELWASNGTKNWNELVRSKTVKKVMKGKTLQPEEWSPDEYEYSQCRLLGVSYGMEKIRRRLDAVRGNASALVFGATGTGKENIAKQLHYLQHGTFLHFHSYNCANVNGDIMKDDFFGHVKGAFTGAASDRKGLFALADNGTLFLDEIQDMPMPIQGLLLRFLNSREYTPQGTSETKYASVRIIAAANRELGKLVAEGKFRADLYFRLAQLVFRIPPLQERPEDIELIANSFWTRNTSEKNEDSLGCLNEEDFRLLKSYDYPGNVRELQNLLIRSIALGKKDFANLLKEQRELTKYFPREDKTDAARPSSSNAIAEDNVDSVKSHMRLEDFILDYVKKVYLENKYNKTRTANELDISYNTLDRYLKRKIETN